MTFTAAVTSLSEKPGQPLDAHSDPSVKVIFWWVLRFCFLDRAALSSFRVINDGTKMTKDTCCA